MFTRSACRAMHLVALFALTMPLAYAQTPAKAAAPAPAKSQPAAKKTNFDASGCFGCHAPIKEFHDAGKHKGLACTSCHTGVDAHISNPSARPQTIMDPANCGTCHTNQFKTMYKMDWERTARKEKGLSNGPSPDPAWDKLMMGHGFVREHNEPRSHAFALYDQLVIDRSFGGRFTNKEGWRFLAKDGGNFKIWDYLEDQYPGQDHKAFKPGTAAAANPVCMSCKTSDHILDWAYMGDPVPGAKWSRTSKVNEFVKDVNHSLNCNFCHDPHSAQPRIIRDGLIQALTRPEKDTLWHKDPRGAKIDVKDLGVRGYTRKIALLSRYDTNLQCGQCHVEYNCNPGTDPTTGQPIGMTDQRTNHFPFKPVTEIGQHYTDLKFRDFKHTVTGALLWKAQHPDTENYYGSKHQLAGVECSQCHMPKVKDPKTGKTFTSHWQTTPKHYIKETCLTCHTDWSAQQVSYTIDSLKNRFAGKVRKAEFWLTRLVDKFEEAQNLGVDGKTLDAARGKHFDAHVNWEWWTASNGAHFHNPEAASDSLNKSMVFSQEGIKLLDDAMATRRKTMASAPSSAAPTAGTAAPAASAK